MFRCWVRHNTNFELFKHGGGPFIHLSCILICIVYFVVYSTCILFVSGTHMLKLCSVYIYLHYRQDNTFEDKAWR